MTVHDDRATLLAPLLKRRAPLNHAKVPFILCWSQKAGCTAALKWFLHHAGHLQEATRFTTRDMSLGIHGYENEVLKARPGYMDDLIADLCRGKPVVSFMRCPFERAFSSYMMLNNGRFLMLAGRGTVTPGIRVRQAVLHFIQADRDDLNRPISFRDYLLWLKEQDFSGLDPHHTPQCTPLYRHICVSHYRLEDFDRAINRLESEFSLELSATARHAFSSAHHRPKSDLPAPDALAFLDEGLPLERFPLAHLPRVTRGLLEGSGLDLLIRDIFAEDIATYDSIEPLAATDGA